MKTISIHKNIVQIILFIGIAFVFFLLPQKTFAACQLTSGQFRNVDYGPNFPPNWFNNSVTQNHNPPNNPHPQPYVYLDLIFNNDCVGQTVSYEIQEGLITSIGVSYQLTAESLQQTSVFRAGGYECFDDCEYNFWIEINGNDIENGEAGYSSNWPQTFGYECIGVCEDYQWQYVGTVYSTTQGYAYGSYKASNDPDFLASDDEQDSEGTVDDDEQDSEGTVDDDEQDSAFIPATISCGDKGCIENPLGDGSSLPAFIQSLLGIIMKAGIPLIILALVYTGFRFVWARGKPEEITKAKHLLLYTVIGSAVILGAWTIATILTNTINLIIS